MLDASVRVAREIVERAKDDVSTHSESCYKYHLACFAQLVVNEADAAESA